MHRGTELPGGLVRWQGLGRWAARAACGILLLASAAYAQTSPSPAAGAATNGVGSQFEMVYWQSVDSGSDASLYEAYLSRYPDGTFVHLAQAKLARLRGANAVPAVPVASPAAAPDYVSAPAPTYVPTPAPAPAPALAPAPAPQTVPARQPAPPSAAEQTSYMADAAPTDGSRAGSENSALQGLLRALGDSQRAVSAPAPTENPSLVAGSPPMAAAPAISPMTQSEPSAPLPSYAAPEQRPIAVGPLPSGFSLPPRPALAAVPPVNLPASFCSADVRNQFHDAVYLPAVEAAKRNNDAAIAYMHALQDLYDRNQLSGDTNPMNAVASEARTYGPVATAAFAAQSALVSAFTTLMAVPIVKCEAKP